MSFRFVSKLSHVCILESELWDLLLSDCFPSVGVLSWIIVVEDSPTLDSCSLELPFPSASLWCLRILPDALRERNCFWLRILFPRWGCCMRVGWAVLELRLSWRTAKEMCVHTSYALYLWNLEPPEIFQSVSLVLDCSPFLWPLNSWSPISFCSGRQEFTNHIKAIAVPKVC